MKKLIIENKKTLLLFIGICFLFYGNTLKNKYALDDEYVTVTNFPIVGKPYTPNNKLVTNGLGGIATIWKSRYAHDEEYSFDYRPFTTTTFAIEYTIFGQSPFISHLINVLLYAIVVCMLFLVLLFLLREYEFKLNIAYLTAVIFLILPSHSEVVNNIKSRDELLCLLFSLTALWSALKLHDKVRIKHIVIMCLSLLLGLFCKRTAILAFAVIPLCFFFYRSVSLKKVIYFLVALFSIIGLAAYTEANLVAEETVRNYYHFENPLYVVHFGLIDRLLITLQSFGFYVKFFFIPYPFRAYYGSGVIDVYNPIDMYFVSAILFIAFSIWFYMKYKSKHFLFAFFLFAGCIFPFVNIIEYMPGVVGERLSFYASIGFALLIAIVFHQFTGAFEVKSFKTFTIKPLVYLVPIVFIAFVCVVIRNNAWRNQVHLFETDAPNLTKSAKANSLLANLYFERLRSNDPKYANAAMFEKTIKYYNLSVAADSSFYSAYNNAGVAYYSFINDYATAKHYFTLAVRHKKEYPQALENIGNCYKAQGDNKMAKHYYLEAIKLNTKQYRAYVSILEMLFAEKDYNRAINCLKITQKQFPNDYALTALNGNCVLMKGDTLQAMPIFETAMSLYQNAELGRFMAKKYLELGDTLNYTKYKNF